MIGLASWFNPVPARWYAGLRVCASNTVPIGHRVRVTNLYNNRKSWCTIIGKGPFAGGRILDVSPLVRDDLGMLHAGVVKVKVIP